jgi:hypothetical protein
MQSVKYWLIDLGLAIYSARRRRYSSRKATNGSTLVARNAGMTVAAKATAARNTGTTKNVVTSLVLTPNNRLAITRVRTAAAVSPARMPIRVNCIPWRRYGDTMCAVEARKE